MRGDLCLSPEPDGQKGAVEELRERKRERWADRGSQRLGGAGGADTGTETQPGEMCGRAGERVGGGLCVHDDELP